jgi:TolA-binding protein
VSALVFVMTCGCGGKLRKSASAVDAAAAAKSDSAEAAKADAEKQRIADSTLAASATRKLSPASELLVASCDNYLTLNPDSPKYPDVLMIKASLYYNSRLMPQARTVYTQVMEKFPSTASSAEAMRMLAQSFYEEKNFDSAQAWYRRLKDLPGNDIDRSEATQRIAESIFKRAEQFELQKLFSNAAEQYKRVPMEFPDAKIADIALFNASLCYEKSAEWSQVILSLGELLQRYPSSAIVPKAMFRIGKANEKLLNWKPAADAYLNMVARFPTAELAPSAMYNAGFCFENAEKLHEAAATFEKTAQLYPASSDAADVLFRAGEIYGKVKDWEGVSRVSKVFTERFGNDADRVVQALCMAGIAQYMQGRDEAAIKQLSQAVATFAQIKKASTANAYYAAKAQYTIGEILHTHMGRIALKLPRAAYQKSLDEKSRYLDQAVDAYSRAVKFNISEWTTRSICQIGQAYEDFAIGISRQERPANLQIADQLALELGIAQAVEKYFIEKALRYYEQNVKLGIKEKIEDKNILHSRSKLTNLPYVAGENFLALARILRQNENEQNLSGFALIGRKLEVLQKIAPFQESAANLFLKCIELGTAYQQIDNWYQKASGSITAISCEMAATYGDVVAIVIEAPIPAAFDSYERFVYKTKLLKQVEGYENQAMTGYLKTLKIATAYNIDDESVVKARDGLANLLFTSGRCKDLLCIDLFTNPPFPKKISEAEKEEYRARFEEIGLKYQEQAFEVYRNILKFAVQKYAAGPATTHAYVRLYQFFPDEFGVPEEQLTDTVITSGPEWRCFADSLPGWQAIDFNDSAWFPAQKSKTAATAIPVFPGKTPIPMARLTTGNPSGDTRTFFRRTFSLGDIPRSATMTLSAGPGTAVAFVNGQLLAADSGTVIANVVTWDLSRKLRSGTNVVAAMVSAPVAPAVLYPSIGIRIGKQVFVARPPLADKNLSEAEVSQENYKFPLIKNFTAEQQGGAKK